LRVKATLRVALRASLDPHSRPEILLLMASKAETALSDAFLLATNNGKGSENMASTQPRRDLYEEISNKVLTRTATSNCA
jgi:hypothetical protein